MADERIVVDIQANLRDRASGGLQRLRRALEQARVGVGPLSVSLTTLAKAGAAVAAALATATTAVLAITRASAEYADTLGRLSTQTGVTVERLSGLRYAMEQSGRSGDDLNTVFAALQVRIGQALTGSVEAAAGFAELGINVRNLARLRADRQIEEIAEATRNLGDQHRRTSALARVFGEDLGPGLIPLLSLGRTGLQDYQRDLESFGSVVTQQTATAARGFNNALGNLGQVFQGFGLRISEQLFPVFTELINNNLGRVQEILEEIIPFAVDLGTGFATLANAAIGLGSAFVDFVIPPFQSFLNVLGSIGTFVTNAVNEIFRLLPPVRDIAEQLGFIRGDTFAPGGGAVDYDVLQQYGYSPNFAAHAAGIDPVNLASGDALAEARAEAQQRLLLDIFTDPTSYLPIPTFGGAAVAGAGGFTRLATHVRNFLNPRGAFDDATEAAFLRFQSVAESSSSRESLQRIFERAADGNRDIARIIRLIAEEQSPEAAAAFDDFYSASVAAIQRSRVPGRGRRVEQVAGAGLFGAGVLTSRLLTEDLARAIGGYGDALTYRVIPSLAGHPLGDVPFTQLLDQSLDAFDADAIRDLRDESARGGASGQVAQNLLDELGRVIREALTIPEALETPTAAPALGAPTIPGAADTRSAAERLGLGLFNPAIQGVRNALSFTQSNLAFGGSADAIQSYRETLGELLRQEADRLREAFREGALDGDEFTQVFAAVSELASSLRESIDEVAMRLRIGIYDATIGGLQTELGIAQAELNIFGTGNVRDERRDLLSAVRSEARELLELRESGGISEELFIAQYTELGNLASSLQSLVDEQRAEREQRQLQPIEITIIDAFGNEEKRVTELQTLINNGRVSLAPSSAGRPY